MLKNYFIVAFRNLRRHKTFSVINIGGLAIGLAACWMISLYVARELSFDKFHARAERIYRVAQHASWNGGRFKLACTAAPMAAALKTDYPEIASTVRFDAEGGSTVSYGEKRLMVGDMFFADSSVFDVFSYQFIAGSAQGSLSAPNSIVITKTLAEKIFGDAATALNKTMLLGKEPNKVTGVINDPPRNSHLKFSALRAMPATQNDWVSSYLYTYVLLKPSSEIKRLEASFGGFYEKYLKGPLGEGIEYHIELQPLTSIHLHSNLDYEISPNGNMRYVTIFSLVALLTLVIASINYTNLSTARASLRVREIGVRKVSGSGRAQLVLMFLAESVLTCLLASAIALVLLKLSLPWCRRFIGEDLDLWHFGFWRTISFLGAFSLFTGCLSGLYPAVFLSGFRLIPALKGQTGSHRANLAFRQSLVVFQFVIAIMMIAGSLVIWQQLQFMLKRNLGFNKDQVLSFHLHSSDMRNKIDVMEQALRGNPAIESLATAGNPIGNNDIGGRDYNVQNENGAMSEKSKVGNLLVIDEDFIPVMQIKMVAGRNFSRNIQTDHQRVIVNETLARAAGWKQPIGRNIQMGTDSTGRPILFEVAGVVNDFNIYSLQHKVEPLILRLPFFTGEKDNMYVRIRAGQAKSALSTIEKVYKELDAANAFEYSFIDQNFAKRYETEKMQARLLLLFTVLAILIACLGLFGLITFTAEQRQKEIGIRKVLGGSVSAIVMLLAGNLVKLVIIAILLAFPLAWWAMHGWLDSFAYRTPLHWWIFAGAGMVALAIAFVTISIQAGRAAIANPSKSLRTE